MNGLVLTHKQEEGAVLRLSPQAKEALKISAKKAIAFATGHAKKIMKLLSGHWKIVMGGIKKRAEAAKKFRKDTKMFINKVIQVLKARYAHD